jgi:hypothetical protein
MGCFVDAYIFELYNEIDAGNRGGEKTWANIRMMK